MNRPFPFAFTLGAIVIVVAYYLFADTEEPTQENIVKEEISSPIESSPSVGLIDSSPSVGLIDDERIINAESEPGNWIAHGRTYEEQRFSPLLKINKDSVSDLGLAWYKDMGTNRALEATPIVVDGIMFFTSTWSRVYAVEAKTGKTIWKFDPEVPGEWARKACCDIVNRGVAVYEG